MQILRTEPTSDDVITLSGDIRPSDVASLRHALVDAVDGTSTDLLIDARTVTAFDERGLTALTAARTRAKFRRRGIVVLDAEGGPVEAALRRSGHLLRLPVYPDLTTARSALASRRSVRARLSLVRAEHAAAVAGRETEPAEGAAVDDPITAASSAVPHAPALANPGRRVIA